MRAKTISRLFQLIIKNPWNDLHNTDLKISEKDWKLDLHLDEDHAGDFLRSEALGLVLELHLHLRQPTNIQNLHNFRQIYIYNLLKGNLKKM